MARVVLALLLLFPASIPSDWAQDVPARHGARHAGMTHSILYPSLGFDELWSE